MPTRELRLLRHQYKAAYTAYMSHVHAVSEFSERGECPPAAIVNAEERAFGELSLMRLALMDALREHTHAEYSRALSSIVRTPERSL